MYASAEGQVQSWEGSTTNTARWVAQLRLVACIRTTPVTHARMPHGLSCSTSGGSLLVVGSSAGLALQQATWHSLGAALNVDPGTLALSPALALDGQGNPVVVWSEARKVGDPFELFVKRWTGTRWEQLGTTPLNVDPAGVASNFAVALDRTGSPYVIWNEGRDAPSRQNIYLKHWTGQAWEQLGGALNPNHRELAYDFSLVLNEAGEPQVAWSEKNEADPAFHLYLTHWTGQTWTVRAQDQQQVFQEGYIDQPNVILDPQGRLTVASSQDGQLRLRRWTGQAWEPLGPEPINVTTDGPAMAIFSSLALDALGQVTVAWSEDMQLYVKRWTGSSWQQLGSGALNTDPEHFVTSSAVALDASGAPSVTWTEHAQVLVRHWTGTAWGPLGTQPLNVMPRSFTGLPALALDAAGTTVAWREGTSPDLPIVLHVKSFR